MKEIKIHTEFITLQALLKLANIISDGGQSKVFILENDIYVNDELEKRRGRKLYPGFTVLVNNEKFLITKNEN